jgi:putative endonuclease
MNTRTRRRAEIRGRTAELIAALWLMAKGYRLLARRARTPHGEADLIATKAGRFIVVEVKARRTRDAGLMAIGPEQQKRIARAGLFLAKRFGMGGASMRLDLVIIRPWALPIHVQNAWTIDWG